MSFFSFFSATWISSLWQRRDSPKCLNRFTFQSFSSFLSSFFLVVFSQFSYVIYAKYLLKITPSPFPGTCFFLLFYLFQKMRSRNSRAFFFTIMPLHDEGISEPSEKIFFSFSKEYYYIFFLSFRKFCYVFFFVIFCFFFKVCWRGNGIYIRDYY